MNYAIIKTGGKQYKVSEDEIVKIEKLIGGKGTKINFKEVLLVNKDKELIIGKPYISKAQVNAEIVDQIKDKKIRVAKFRAKSRYRKVKGHRQLITKVKILKINASINN